MTDQAATTITGGQALVGQLLAEGVDTIFGIPGVQLDWAVDAIRQAGDRIRFVVPRHEQATSYMADGYARTTGREGVCMVVPGPGMLNALSGLATAYACNARVLMIVGQIPSPRIGQGRGLLHEIPDQSGILKSLTKWHAIARRPEDIPALINQAFDALRSGRPRPVAIEIPPDVLEAAAETLILPRAPYRPATPKTADIAKAVALLAEARLPVIFAGGGAVASDASDALGELAERLQAPVVMSEGGRGALPDGHPLALTSLGGRLLLPRADVILVAGSRFVDATGAPLYQRDDCSFVYLNADEADLAGPRQQGLSILGDVRVGFEAMLAGLPSAVRVDRTETIAKAKAWADQQIKMVQPQSSYVDAIRSSMADDDIFISELTQVGYFANIAFPVRGARRYVTPGYQGTLGYGFNTALGAAIGHPEGRTVSVSGDGGFGWGMQELATLAREKPNLSVIIFVDGEFGNVKRIQKRVFGTTFATELQNPDFALLAKAFEIPFSEVSTPQELNAALVSAAEQQGPILIVVRVGDMPSPWPLIHAFLPPIQPVPPDPLS